MRIFISLFLLIAFFYVNPFSHVFAFTTSLSHTPAITVVNPIRGSGLGHENDDLVKSLQAQWEVTHAAHVNATWLWQYSALENRHLIDYAKSSMSQQEFGLWFEVDRNSAQKAGVQYRGQGPWYFSDGLFLFSYDLDERKKLIDTSFAKFKSVFGYYPKTVGAWWIDAQSLTYMHQTYGVIASLRAADQFDLDVYTVWGTPWSIPYLSSEENAGIPASSFQTSSHIVMLQWAPRDPMQGYFDSTYSLQDYDLKKYDTSYFDYLLSIYAHKPFDQVVIGLENGGTRALYEGHYENVLHEAAKLQSEHKIVIALAKDYASSFLQKKFVLQPTHYFLAKNFNTQDQSFWYNSSDYRIGIQKQGENIFLIDVRNYTQKLSEDFEVLPNSQGFLRINESGSIDSRVFPSQKTLLFKSKDSLHIQTKDKGILLLSGVKPLGFFTPSCFSFLPVGKSPFFSFPAYCHMHNNLSLYGSDDTLFFSFFLDKKQLFLAPLLQFVSFGSIPFRMLFVFYLFPLFLLLLSLFLLIFLKLQHTLTHKIKVFCGMFVVSIFFLFLRIPYFPFDHSTIKLIAAFFLFLFLLLIFFNFFIWKMRLSLRFFLASILGSFFLMVSIGILFFFSRSQLIVTPFEMRSLQFIAAQHRDVLYLFPSTKPIYKAIRPALYDDYYLGSDITHTNWKKISLSVNTEDTIRFLSYKGKLVVVPRYLGVELNQAEIEHLGLRKVYDNLQIVIYLSH